MSKKIKHIIVFLCAIIFIVIIVLVFYNQNVTHYNDDTFQGNTAGNLYNGGIICEYDGKIYFSNFSDDGALYSMDLDCTNVKKIADDRAEYINVDPHYIYYSRNNQKKTGGTKSIFSFYNAGVYRINHNGENVTLLDKNPSGIVNLYGNQVYYQQYTNSTAIQFYQVRIDSKKQMMVSKEPILPACIYNGRLYYAGAKDEHSIHALDLETNEEYDILQGNCYMPIATADGIYYISADDNYSLCRVDFDGENKAVLVDRFCSSYNISDDGSTIYYQVDGGDDNRICKLDIPSMVTETILDGDYKNIQVTSTYVFFRDFNENNTYAYDSASGTLKTFHPPVIE